MIDSQVFPPPIYKFIGPVHHSYDEGARSNDPDFIIVEKKTADRSTI
jgi:hypothetical protein